MTVMGQLYRRVQVALDRLAWGFGDLRRVLIERGFWPGLAQTLASIDGGYWSVTETRLQAQTSPRKAVGLLVPESEGLWGRVQLPEMPRNALESAVEEALWRVSPLPREQIVAAWRAKPEAQGGWTVEWGVCRRSDCEAWLMAQGLSVDAPVYLGRQGRALAVRGKHWQIRQKRQRWIHALVVLLGLTLLGMVALPALMPLVLKREAVLRAVQHVAMVEPKAAPLRQQLEELRRQAALAQELQQNLSKDLPLASVIDALSQTLPDDTWLDRIEINGSEIRISGLTGNATELVAHLGREPRFAEARASVASVRDNTQNKERFTFEMRWRGEGSKP